MTDLRAAAQQALEALEGGADSWQLVGPAIDALKAALAEPEQEQYPLHDQQLRDDAERWKNIRGYVEEMEREIKTLRAALAEPVQEPDDPARRCGGPGCDGTCCQPVQEPVAYSEGRTLHWHEGKGVSDAQLFAVPPQRKPLAEWQINDLMADIDPEDRDSWSFRQGVYAAEKHHGVRK